MAALGYTPISLYYSTTASAVPTSGNLVNGELALNTADMKLYAKNSSGVVTLLASSGGASGTVSSVAASVPSFLSIAGSPITTSGTLAISLSGTALPTTSGGTGLTSFTSGGVVYASSTSALATGSALVFDGTNLGLGVTPSAWAQSKALDIGNFGALSCDTISDGNVSVAWNCYATAYNAWKYKGIGTASKYTQEAGKHYWYTAGSGTAGNAISFTQAMTLDASGRLVIGDTTATQKLTVVNNNGTYGTIYQPIVQIGNTSSGGTTSANTGLGAIVWSTDGTATPVASIEAIRENPGSGAASALAFRTGSSSGGTERARIDSSGNFGIGTTSPSGNGRLELNVPSGNNTNLTFYENGSGRWLIGSVTGSNAFRFYDLANATERFQIASNGAWGLAGANYGTTGQVLTSNGSGSAPTWQTAGGGTTFLYSPFSYPLL